MVDDNIGLILGLFLKHLLRYCDLRPDNTAVDRRAPAPRIGLLLKFVSNAQARNGWISNETSLMSQEAADIRLSRWLNDKYEIIILFLRCD